MNESFSIITDLEQLKDNFSARLKELLKTDHIYILMLNPDLNRYLTVENIITNSHPKDILYFNTSDKLIFWLSVNKTFLEINQNAQVFDFFTRREQELLKQRKISLIYPFIVMNQVRGMVCICNKENNVPFNDNELQYLKIFLDQAGFAFENALLYQVQKERTRKMYRADRLATLGELSAGAAHEIRNPLTSIRSSIQFLKRKFNDSTDIEMANDLISEVDRINEIIEGMLSFAKPQPLKKENTQLKTILLQTIQLVSNTARKEGIEICLNYQAEREDIFADPSQLKQVFLNIIMNSIQAIESEPGKIDINIIFSDGQYRYTPEYLIEVIDNGKGIPNENIDKIFDPFFTTKNEGTGLGLSISYGIINQHGGDIEFFSNPGIGTKAKIRIPVK
ncbi:MAG TPA: ATP-binding protein [Bacteroidales bacterium]|nr:ATP-binding protein [Bacteroidales bacterium]